MEQEHPVQTKFGQVTLRLNSATAIYFRGGVRVNGVDLTLSCHLGKYDGEWQLGREKGQSFGNYHLLSLRKANKEDASQNARDKVLPELCRVAAEWVRDNQHLVQEREEEIKREKIVSLRHRLSTMLAEADMLRDEIARLEGTPAAIVALS